MSVAKLDSAFFYTLVPYGDDGKMVRGIIARCGAPGCQAAIPLPVNTFRQGDKQGDDRVVWSFIARKLEAKGWRIGHSFNAHRCPRCFGAAKFSAIRKHKQAHATEAAAMVDKLQIVKGDGMRTMAREDRRIIFEKLNEVYLSDTVGYADGWTDEKVAVDLGVPRAWVKLIRDENFGDEIANGAIREQLIEARAVLAEIRAMQPQVAEVQRLFSVADKIEKHLVEIARVMK